MRVRGRKSPAFAGLESRKMQVVRAPLQRPGDDNTGQPGPLEGLGSGGFGAPQAGVGELYAPSAHKSPRRGARAPIARALVALPPSLGGKAPSERVSMPDGVFAAPRGTTPAPTASLIDSVKSLAACCGRARKRSTAGAPQLRLRGAAQPTPAGISRSRTSTRGRRRSTSSRSSVPAPKCWVDSAPQATP